jgi:hypothetical protein
MLKFRRLRGVLGKDQEAYKRIDGNDMSIAAWLLQWTETKRQQHGTIFSCYKGYRERGNRGKCTVPG